METPADTPSGRILAAAARRLRVVDGTGRSLELRQMGALDKLRMFKALGPALSQNAPYLGMAMLACSVTAIDDVPVPPPANEQQVEQMVQRLGDVGITAVAGALDATEATAPASSGEGGTAGN